MSSINESRSASDLTLCANAEPDAANPLLDAMMKRHAGIGWRCSLKNSFLHFTPQDDFACDSDEDTHDDGSNASQRSSSVPSRFEYDEKMTVSASLGTSCM